MLDTVLFHLKAAFGDDTLEFSLLWKNSPFSHFQVLTKASVVK